MATAQAVHATADFCRKYPEYSEEWTATSNRVVVLSISDEEALLDIADVFCWWECPTVVFYEPDIDGHTAIATSGVGCYENVDLPTNPEKILSSLSLYQKGGDK